MYQKCKCHNSVNIFCAKLSVFLAGNHKITLLCGAYEITRIKHIFILIQQFIAAQLPLGQPCTQLPNLD